ncbi:hypothetical protein D3C73_998710 [compost metagenome]
MICLMKVVKKTGISAAMLEILPILCLKVDLNLVDFYEKDHECIEQKSLYI